MRIGKNNNAFLDCVLEYCFCNCNLWFCNYYCGSAGHVSQEQVKRYILEQQGKDVFEYDIFNCPKELKGQLKIGDFMGGN